MPLASSTSPGEPTPIAASSLASASASVQAPRIVSAIVSATSCGPPAVGVGRRIWPRTENCSSTTTVCTFVPPRSTPARRVMMGIVPDRTELERVRALCLALPEVTERLSHGSPTWFVGAKKTFVMYHDDHHGDGRLALWCAAPEGMQAALVAGGAGGEFVARPPRPPRGGGGGARRRRGRGGGGRGGGVGGRPARPRAGLERDRRGDRGGVPPDRPEAARRPGDPRAPLGRALEDHDRDLPVGLLLVVVVVGPVLGHLLPQCRPLLGRGVARPGGELVVLDLHLHLGVVAQVEVPARMRRGAALGGDDHRVVAGHAVDQGVLALLTGLAAGRGEDEDRGAVLPLVPVLAVGLLVDADVLGAVQLGCVSHACRFTRFVSTGPRWRPPPSPPAPPPADRGRGAPDSRG